jgi:hypothetical protein
LAQDWPTIRAQAPLVNQRRGASAILMPQDGWLGQRAGMTPELR